MITLNDVFQSDNLELAMEDILSRPNSCGTDGIYIVDFPEYWRVNQAEIIDAVMNANYYPGPVKMTQIVNKKGKRRMVATMDTVDRFISRAIIQVLDREIEPRLADVCFAYRKGKSTSDAANLAATYMESGKFWVAEIDIESFFDSIPKDGMFKRVSELISDDSLLQLIERYIYQEVESDGAVFQPKTGIVQGSPLSPAFSNLYLSEMDWKLLDRGMSFYRYGDDINVYAESFDLANEAMLYVKELLNQLGLAVNIEKGGIFPGKNRKCLGYEFVERSEKILVQRVAHKKSEIYRHWTQTSIQKVGANYHLINDGILTRKDYSVLFEEASGKYYIPVEVTDSLNIYSNVVVSSGFFEYMNAERLPVNFFNRKGEKVGTFLPNRIRGDYGVECAQIQLLANEKEHLKIAKKYQNANIFNMRAVLRYYQRREDNEVIDETILQLTEILSKVNEVKEVGVLMVYEAQARQMYFHCFNEIISDDDFKFIKRTRRPPRDALNAMISFGNTLLYQRFAAQIYSSKLDIRFGILHNSKHRAESLNLDLADLFKPVIVDRTIFTLVNRKMLDVDDCFRDTDSEGVYLSEKGKRIFIKEFESKVNQKIRLGKKQVTYDKLMHDEVMKIQRYFSNAEVYKPYKYVN